LAPVDGKVTPLPDAMLPATLSNVVQRLLSLPPEVTVERQPRRPRHALHNLERRRFADPLPPELAAVLKDLKRRAACLPNVQMNLAIVRLACWFYEWAVLGRAALWP
jgi:hypothetical protein